MAFNLQNSRVVGQQESEKTPSEKKGFFIAPKKEVHPMMERLLSNKQQISGTYNLQEGLFTRVARDLYQYCDICRTETPHARRYRNRFTMSAVCLSCGQIIQYAH